MPANPKYLTTNPWQRLAKFIAGFVGGYLITSLLHMIFAILFPLHKEALVTSIFTMFIVWVIFMIIPYLYKNGWKVLLIYVGTILLLAGIYYLIQPLNPFIHE